MYTQQDYNYVYLMIMSFILVGYVGSFICGMLNLLRYLYGDKVMMYLKELEKELEKSEILTNLLYIFQALIYFGSFGVVIYYFIKYLNAVRGY